MSKKKEKKRPDGESNIEMKATGSFLFFFLFPSFDSRFFRIEKLQVVKETSDWEKESLQFLLMVLDDMFDG